MTQLMTDDDGSSQWLLVDGIAGYAAMIIALLSRKEVCFLTLLILYDCKLMYGYDVLYDCNILCDCKLVYGYDVLYAFNLLCDCKLMYGYDVMYDCNILCDCKVSCGW